MVAAVGTRVTQAAALAAVRISAVDLRLSQAAALVALNYPTPFELTTQAAALVAVRSTIETHVSQAAILVAVRGRTSNPKLRAWTFTLDGHDFYVLRLGMDVTLVYDVSTEQWVDWDAFSETYWPVNVGINWPGGTRYGDDFGSNVIVGDDTYGLVYFLNPDQPYDQNPESLDPDQEIPFERVLQGQVPMVGRQVLPCYSVWLTTDMGAPAYVGASVTLEISDDAGVSYADMGAVTVTGGKNSPQLAWYSLGQIEAPGRLFRITDDGAIARIDTMEMNDPDDK